MLPVTTLTINISSVALIWFGAIGIDAGHMQVGSLIAFLSYFMQILMAVLMATLVLAILPRARCAPSGSPRCSTPAHQSPIPVAAPPDRRDPRPTSPSTT